MMEVDHISYIFGSFSRRRQSQEVGTSKRRSINTLNISHDRSKSAPHTSQVVDLPESRAKSMCITNQDNDKFKCPVCKKYFIEPKVLPCLHTFCTKCLQELVPNNENGWDACLLSPRIRHHSGSGGSACDSDKLTPLPSNNKPPNTLSCPTCGVNSKLSSGGILSLPPNFLLQHRMILETLNSSSTNLLCDFCSDEISATFRCTECAVSLCKMCSDIHKRQKSYAQHEVLHLEEARRKGINRVQRLVMCLDHPEQELSLFCSTCCQVICRECIKNAHRGHVCDLASRAAKSFTIDMKEALEKLKSMAKQATRASTRLQADSKRIENRSNEVQGEVEKFMNSYIRSVEEHKKKLDDQINCAREEKLQTIEERKIEIQKKLNEMKDIVLFTDELLNEGTDVEFLSFVKPICKKLKKYENLDQFANYKESEGLFFLPKEIINYPDGFCPLYGAVTTETATPKYCTINQEALNNLRVGKRVELKLELKDCNNTTLHRGGDHVTAELRHRDPNIKRPLLVHVDDRRNGSYVVCFTPDIAGKLILSIQIKEQHIKNSPFTLTVQATRPHHGTFHCCTFCSSGGSKEAVCGCQGKMPGGYKGCGHGHDGHPGKRHWSCCGNILENSECIRTNSAHYQFTL